ncbi:MAG: hypothetical protein ACPGRD_07680, partial [Planktomarina sp.]
MSVFLHGLKLGYYRGIGPTQTIAPLKKFNFFVGPNNSGKSALLQFIHSEQTAILRKKFGEISASGADKFIGNEPSATHVEIGVPFKGFDNFSNQRLDTLQAIKSLLESFSKSQIVWQGQRQPTGNYSIFSADHEEKLKSTYDYYFWRQVWNEVTNRTGGALDLWVKETLEYISKRFTYDFPEVKMIPAMRQIGNLDEQLA